ncbi:MAG: anti-sigma factor [Acidimicrobiia bacterium]
MRWPWRRRPDELDCATVGKLLQRYLDGELDDVRAAQLSAHLEDCVRCGLEADAYERLKASLAAKGTVADGDPALARLRLFAASLLEEPPPLEP